MTCQQHADIDTAERYVAGVMEPDEEVAYEQHFLGCDVCLDTIRGVEDVRDVLAAARATAAMTMRPAREEAAAVRKGVEPPARAAGLPRWVWGAAAAVLIGGVLWLRAIAPSPRDPEVARQTTAPESRPAPSSSTPAAPSPAEAQQARIDRIARLAIVVPPPYVSVPVRAESDSTVRAFDAAMARYRARDYAGAAERLRALVSVAPDVASAQFFLGISELMQQQPARAEGPLQRAASSGIMPFADEAHFYLAKAALQRNDLAAAERELTMAMQRDAGPENDARMLLTEVRNLRAEEPAAK